MSILNVNFARAFNTFGGKAFLKMKKIIIILHIFSIAYCFGWDENNLIDLNRRMEAKYDCDFSFLFIIDKTNGSGGNTRQNAQTFGFWL